MADNLEYFEKFIIKQIVDTVTYNPETDEYEINNIQVSDDVINLINDEGKRYGLSQQQIGQIISKIAGNINARPSVKVCYTTIYVDKLEKGKHLRINIDHPVKGDHFLELLVIGPAHFFVLDTNITGVGYGDDLYAIDRIWNNSYYLDFRVFRKSERFPNDVTILRLGKLYSVEFFTPSIVNDIIDSKLTYTHEELNETDAASQNKTYYVGVPTRWTPITFSWHENSYMQHENCIFVIKDDATLGTKILFNKYFSFENIQNIDDFMSVLHDCCKWRNAFIDIEHLKFVKNVKAGSLKMIKTDLDSVEWELITLPQIKFIYHD